jgi:hypothetical protein
VTAPLIDRVIADLDRVIDRAIETDDRIGYFAALYRRVTVKVKEGVETPGFFEDPERMDRLDFTFASRFLDALATWQAGGRPTLAWVAAFEATRSWRPVILQQLVLGINAHINLDLGIAAARTSPGAELARLRGDFGRINQILASLVGLVERQIGELSPWFGLLARIAGEDGVRVVEFSMRIARDEAWRLAEELAPLPEADQGPVVDLRDRDTARLARDILHPGPLLDAVAILVRLREVRDVRRIIEVLSAPAPPVTTLAEPADPGAADRVPGGRDRPTHGPDQG